MMNEQDRLLTEYLMSEGAVRPEEEAMQRRAQRVAQLRQAKSRFGGQTMEGARGMPGIYVSGSPIDAINDAVTPFLQKREEDKLNADQTAFGDAKQKRLRDLLERYRSGGQPMPERGTNWVGEPYTGAFGDER